MSKEVVWVNYGLDGVGSYLLLKWLRATDVEVHLTTPKRFRDDFIKWQIKSGTVTYKRIFLLNLDLSKCLDIIDLPNCVIIDNHQSHIDRKNLYSNAQTILINATSTTRLVFRIFKTELLKRINSKQIYLISLVDDYISGAHKHTTSKLLNAAYWSSSGDRLQKFVAEFDQGFKGFNTHQQNAINIYLKKLDQTINELDIFEGSIPFKNTNYKVISTFAADFYEEITHHMLHAYKADIVLLVNLSAKTVFFRKSKTCNVPVAKLAERLCDGGGSEYFAGGDITDKFMDFCKTLNQIC